MLFTRSTAADYAWLLACFAVSSLWCVTCAFRIGPTFDEPVYIAQGLAAWRTWSHGGLMSLGTMPLAIDLQTLPLYLWESWRGTPIDPADELHIVLPWARMMSLSFWGILLVYALLIGRSIAGHWGGRIAVALVACEPNLLAHASLATTDLALTACLMATLFHFERGRSSQHWVLRVGLPALCCTAAVLAKASAIVFLPLCFVALESVRLAASGAFRTDHAQRRLFSRVWDMARQFRPLARDYLQLAMISFVLVMAYCGTDWRPENDFVDWARELPPGRGATAMAWLADHLCIFPNAGEAFVRQVKHNLHGHPMYIAGESGQRGVWYYFPLLLLVKLPLPLVVCAICLPLAARRTAWSWPLCCAAMLLAYSFSFRVQIGVRMVLPIVAILAIGVALALVRLQNSHSGSRRRLFTGLTAAAVIATISSSLAVWPHGLCYANALWGGAERSYVIVSDSNYDWGQGVPDLLRWQRARGIGEIDIWYFGTDPRIGVPPLRSLPLHQLSISSPEELLRTVSGRYLAVGATIVHGGYVPAEGTQPAAGLVRFLRAETPIDRAGPLLIYDLAQHPRWAEARGTRDRLARSSMEQSLLPR